MRIVGQLCLLLTLVCTGYAAFVCVAAGNGRRWVARVGVAAALTASLALTFVLGILACALITRDFRFEYVSQYSSRLLPWQFSLSAIWVGQAGSLLLWAWMLALLATLFRLLPTSDRGLRDTAFGFLMGNVGFLVMILVFAADPMKAGLESPQEGLGLSPLLQHPSMLVHPPVVFFAYSTWAFPFALGMAALVRGRLDAMWTQMARPWAIVAWASLGVGLLLGAHWAYQELGWGGYWGWDPVENGSLLPWLSGTALIHGLMAWRYRGCMKKGTIALAIFTFALCNFATFLTRSGIFSSVHAFSQSPIGWMFLGLMLSLLMGGLALILVRRKALAAEKTTRSLLSRESLIFASTCLLVTLTLVVMCGTLVDPLSKLLLGRTGQIGPPFYNNVLIPIALSVLSATVGAPLMRWGDRPTRRQLHMLSCCGILSVAAAGVAWMAGARHPILLLVTSLAVMACSTPVAALLLEGSRRNPSAVWRGSLAALAANRRQYAGFAVHLGFVAIAIGVTGSSLGTKRQEFLLREGDVVSWNDRRIEYVRLEQRALSDKLIAEAILSVSSADRETFTLKPARHLHVLQNEWTTEVAIDSTLRSDFYTILHAGLGDGRISLTFVENPMMQWIWIGGLVSVVGALAALVPSAGTRRAHALPLADEQDHAGATVPYSKQAA